MIVSHFKCNINNLVCNKNTLLVDKINARGETMLIIDKENYERVKATISMNNLRKLIDSKDYSVVKLATNAGVSSSAINAYLNGQKLPSVTTLVSMANYLNCNTDFLLGRTNFPDDYESLYEGSVPNPKVSLLLHIIRSLPDHEIDLVEAYVKGLIDNRNHR